MIQGRCHHRHRNERAQCRQRPLRVSARPQNPMATAIFSTGPKPSLPMDSSLTSVIVVAKTDPAQGAHGTSLFLVESSAEGFSRGRNLEKLGLKAQDTSELFFENVRLGADALLGPQNGGFMLLMQELAQERFSVAVVAMAAAESAIRWTQDYVKERRLSVARLPNFKTPDSSSPR